MKIYYAIQCRSNKEQSKLREFLLKWATPGDMQIDLFCNRERTSILIGHMQFSHVQPNRQHWFEQLIKIWFYAWKSFGIYLWGRIFTKPSPFHQGMISCLRCKILKQKLRCYFLCWLLILSLNRARWVEVKSL